MKLTDQEKREVELVWLEKHRRMKMAWHEFSGIPLIVNLAVFVMGRWVA